MNRSDWLTDDLIQAAFERRAGRADPDDLRETILTLSAASSQRSPWHVQLRSTMSTLALRPASLRGVAIATVIGVIAVGAAFFVIRRGVPPVGGPSPSPSASLAVDPTATPPVAVASPRAATWTATGSMITPRLGHRAVLLLDGRVLVVGGGAAVSGADDHTSAELYDPGSGTWSATASMLAPRDDFSATLLADGKVLVAGGAGNDGALAEVYDPTSGTWSATGSMVAPCYFHAATRLLDGKVLVAGCTGYTGAPTPAELYDPISGTWTATGATSTVSSTATLLPDGKVLVTGVNGAELLQDRIPASELYDPISGTWSATGNMITPTWGTTTLLPDGNVLVAGFADGGTDELASAQLYDPQSGTWSATQAMVAARTGHAAVLLADGKVLVTGGITTDADGTGTVWLASAELYDPASGTWSATASMVVELGYGHTATLLADGKVLVTGGMGIVPMMGGTGSAMVASAELYDPGSGN